MTNWLKHYPVFYITVFTVLLSGLLSWLGLGAWSNILITVVTVAAALWMTVGMVRDLSRGKFGVDILAILAIIASDVAGQYWAAIVVLLMLSGGEALEAYAGRRARRELSLLLRKSPQTAHLVSSTGATRDLQVSDVSVGDTLVVYKREVLPVDGKLSSKTAILDQASLTGEALPVTLKTDAELMSGAINVGDTIMMVATRVAKDSQYQQIVNLVSQAMGTEAPVIRLADRFAVPFTAISLLIAGVSWWSTGDFERVVSVLVLATPCPLILATPIAMISGMSRLARDGIMVKSGVVFELLSRVRSVAMDKTGTLTTGELAVNNVMPEPGMNESELLGLVAAVESESAHPVAKALLKRAQHDKIKLAAANIIEETVGYGVEARIGQHYVLVGSKRFLQRHKVKLHDVVDKTITGTTVWASQDGVFKGKIALQDKPRQDSKRTVKALHGLGINDVVMLTGDNNITATEMANQLSISNVRSEMLPRDKVAAVKKMQPRPVLFVGDGVNDAPVLASADIGVAMGSRTATVASQTADVVILVDKIMRVWEAIYVSRQTVKIARQGILIGIGVSVALMLFAAITNTIPPVLGAILQEMLDVAIILNALRAHSIEIPRTVG